MTLTQRFYICLFFYIVFYVFLCASVTFFSLLFSCPGFSSLLLPLSLPLSFLSFLSLQLSLLSFFVLTTLPFSPSHLLVFLSFFLFLFSFHPSSVVNSVVLFPSCWLSLLPVFFSLVTHGLSVTVVFFLPLYSLTLSLP